MKNQPLSERQQDTIFAADQLKAHQELATKALLQTYTIHPARYAKSKMAIRCIPNGTGWKTLAALIISEMPGVRFSGRERSYIVSPKCATKFEAKMAEIESQRKGTANL